MKILIACEFSGYVRDAFIRKGHDAVSCDLLSTEKPSGPHLQRDVRDIIPQAPWDMMIAFPPCTHLSASGARWWPKRQKEQAEAIEFVRLLLDAPIPRNALENPVGILSTAIRKPDQIIQPWQFGHGEVKTTCLWLKGLPPLIPSEIVEGREQRVWKEPKQAGRWKRRSRTYLGIAEAMAKQWGAPAAIESSAPAGGRGEVK